MNDDRMTPEALADIEGKSKKCASNKLPALALIFSTERELALDAVPQMAAEIRLGWKLLEKAEALIDRLGCHNCYLDFGDEACAGCRVKAWEDFLSENGGNHE